MAGCSPSCAKRKCNRGRVRTQAKSRRGGAPRRAEASRRSRARVAQASRSRRWPAGPARPTRHAGIERESFAPRRPSDRCSGDALFRRYRLSHRLRDGLLDLLHDPDHVRDARERPRRRDRSRAAFRGRLDGGGPPERPRLRSLADPVLECDRAGHLFRRPRDAARLARRLAAQAAGAVGPRCLDRSCQPGALRGERRSRAGEGPPLPQAADRRLHRPGQLQAGQRHAGPRCGRRPAERHAAHRAGVDSDRRTPLGGSAATSSPSSCPRPASRRPTRSWSGCASPSRPAFPGNGL